MTVTETVHSFVATARDRDITFLAAGVAYYAFVSVIPLMILALVASSYLGGVSFARPLLQQVETVAPQMAEMLRQALQNTSGRLGAGVAGFATLLWSAMKLFRGLEVAFDAVYDAAGEDSFLQQVKDALVLLVLLPLAVVLMSVAGTFVTVVPLPGLPYDGRVLATLALFVGLAVVFLPLYYVMPPVSVSLSHVLPGTLFAAVGWVLLQLVFVLFVSNAAKYQAYGVLGGILLFITWLYAAGVVVLAGAVLNVAVERPSRLAKQYPSR